MDGLRRLDAPAPVVRVPRLNAVGDGAFVSSASSFGGLSFGVSTSAPPLKFSSSDDAFMCLLNHLDDRLFAADGVILSLWPAAASTDRTSNVRLSFALNDNIEKQIATKRLPLAHFVMNRSPPAAP